MFYKNRKKIINLHKSTFIENIRKTKKYFLFTGKLLKCYLGHLEVNRLTGDDLASPYINIIYKTEFQTLFLIIHKILELIKIRPTKESFIDTSCSFQIDSFV